MIAATVKIPGYVITEKIYIGTRTIVYKAVRECNQAPVVIKLMRPDPSFDEIVHFRNQYTIAANLNIPGIVKPYSLEMYGNSYALIMEYGGISLKEWLLASTQLTIPHFLQIAIQITTTLDLLHRNRIIHKDIKPANILINPETRLIKITDFSISSIILRDQQLQRNILEGTLAYISPEQTGRINRGVDYRSDFYSLGVTFYELLTGQLPFNTNEPSELVHCHITKQPIAVDVINKDIPKVLAVIVSKLMAKNPEERYQSARGLKYDLEAGLDLYQNNEGTSNTIFPLGTKDISDRFLIPGKLYGREAEVNTLLKAFRRVTIPPQSPLIKGGSWRGLLLLRGFSGTGKTALVNEIQQPIVRAKGYFIKGKYDQFARNVPFFGFVQAFRDLIEQLLTESESRIIEWKNRVLDAVGENKQVIIDVIPDVELLIGTQTPCTELEPTTAQNRFHLVFQKFIRVFCSAEHPLVIFLDDLQWADTASLQLISSLVEVEYLLLIGAYRHNEVNKTHRLMSTIDDIQNAGVTVETITLNALSFDAANQLVADTLNSDVDRTVPLTEYIYSKTQGNSFFTRELLNTLYQEQVIYFDYERSIWEWQLNTAQNLPLSNNVVEFMVSKLLSLPTATQDVLKLAASIGNQFDLQMLATVSELTVNETAAALWNSVQAGLILTTSQVYKYLQSQADSMVLDNPEQLAFTFQFLHDRVQQAAYTLISDTIKSSVHLKIGRLLLKSIAPEKREERIFDLVNQLNYGVELITHQLERDELARLNLVACRKARSATAYSAAGEYANLGIKLLEEDGWQRQYELTLALHELGAEVAYLCGQLQQMEYFVNQVTQNARVLLHQIKVHEIKIQAYISQNRFVDGIQSALAILQHLGITFPELPTPEHFQRAMAEVAIYIYENSINDLSALAPMQDEQMLAATRILSSVASAAYIGMAQLYPLIILKQVSILIKYGNAPSSAYSYATYGLILCAFGNDIEAGNRCGDAALKLLDLFKANEFKAKVINLVYPFVRPWKTHLQVLTQPLLDGYHSGLDTGDLEFGAYCAFNYCNLCYWSGKNLAWLVDEMDLYNQAMLQLKQESARNFQRIFYQAALNLTTNNTNPITFNGAVYNELEMLPIHTAAGDSYSIGTLYLHKLVLCVIFGDNEQGVENAILAEQYVGAIAGTYYSSLIPFYDSLCQLGIYSTQSTHQQQVILEKVRYNQDKIQNWANHAPMNHLHKWYLVEAEQHRVLNNKIEAIDCYDKAIVLAQESGYINEEALCCELATKFYLAWGKPLIAQTYIIKAYEVYQHWGAKAKLAHLTSNYSQLLTPSQSIIIKTDKFATISSSSTTASEYLDFKAVLKASQSLSSQINLDNLVSTLMQVVLENAGADKGVLLLLKNNMLEVAAHSDDVCNVQFPNNLINYARNTRKSIIINHVGANTEFTEDAYFKINQPQSLLCTPIINQSRLIGVLYLENNLIREAFTSDRVEVLNLLCSQAAISLLNATLYQTSQNYAQKLKQNLQEQKILAGELQQTLEELKDAQTQLVQNEKMSALGNLVAGVAHEINNPVGFIAGNIQPALNFVNDIFKLLDLYQEKFPDPGAEIYQEIETIDLNFVRQDLPKLLSSMKEGVQRIRSISNSLRTFSRADTETKVSFDIHDGLNSTVMILSHRLKASEHRPQIEIVKNYAKLPHIQCFPGQLNQVFMNLLANAIDALEESNTGCSFQEIQLNPNCITIKTSLSTDAQKIIVYIKDNGKGMTEEVKQRIFDHLFTTKAVGKGTGIGLAIARQIIIEKHGGNIKVNSTLGDGAEFIIEIPVD